MSKFKHSSLLILITIAIPLSVSSLCIYLPEGFAGSSNVADFLFETGKKYYEQGNYRQALHELEKALLAEPEHPQALMYVRIIEQELGFTPDEEAVAEALQEAEAQVAAERELLPEEVELGEEKVAEELAVPAISEEKAKTDEYILGIGDVLEVTVWRHDELSKIVTIRPDGRIALVLAGELKASGLTASELNRVIKSRLSKFIKDPNVTIIVSKFGSKNILVLGEVNRPGVYNISGPLTALQAIAQAGSYKKYAGLKSTMVVRKAYSDCPEIISTDLWSVISEGEFGNDVALQPGDIVYVPKRFLGKVEDFLSFFHSNIRPIADTYIFYENID